MMDVHRYLNQVVLALVGLAVYLAIAPASADSIRLYDQAAVTVMEVTLDDIADIDGPTIQHLGKLVLAKIGLNTTSVDVSLVDIQNTLLGVGVNVASLSLGGFPTCHVEWIPERQPVVVASGNAPIIANSIRAVDTNSSMSLRDHLYRWMAHYSGINRDELYIQISSRDAKMLDLPVEEGTCDFSAPRESVLGRLPVLIRQYKDGRVVKTINVRPLVARRTLAVVAIRKIRSGEAFSRDNVATRPVLLERDRDRPVTELSGVLGKIADTSLRSGAIVLAGQVRHPLLVHRDDLVTVRCFSGGVVLKTIGRAEEDGRLGQVIQVCNERAFREIGRRRADRVRTTFSARVSGIRQVVTPLTDQDVMASHRDKEPLKVGG